jgi:hypothetical protein
VVDDQLASGLQYFRPGRTTASVRFAAVLAKLLAYPGKQAPRHVVRRKRKWDHSVACLVPLIERAMTARRRKSLT